MRPLETQQVRKIQKLRKTGHSIPEIAKLTGFGKATISRYCQGVAIVGRYKEILRNKKGANKIRANLAWQSAKKQAQKTLTPPFSKRERMLVLATLYWGEGTKRELDFINSDVAMIRVFLDGLRELGVHRESIQLSLRLFEDLDIQKAKTYWATQLDFKVSEIQAIHLIHGKKKGRLPYGMCRVRVRKNAPYFKKIMSMIQILSEEF